MEQELIKIRDSDSDDKGGLVDELFCKLDPVPRARMEMLMAHYNGVLDLQNKGDFDVFMAKALFWLNLDSA